MDTAFNLLTPFLLFTGPSLASVIVQMFCLLLHLLIVITRQVFLTQVHQQHVQTLLKTEQRLLQLVSGRQSF